MSRKEPWTGPRCRYCSGSAGKKPPAVRIVEVALPPDGDLGWRFMRLPIDVWPHAEGDVVRDPDGTYRKLTLVSDAEPHQALFRIHSAQACAGLDQAPVMA